MNKSTPELTICLPVHNSEKYLKDAVQSILQQEDVEIEVIIVDDSSADNSVEVVYSFSDERLRLINNNRRMGVAYCRNRIIEQSISPFLTFLDATWVLLPDAFQKILSTLRSNPEIGLVGCDHFYVEADSLITRDHFRGRSGFALENLKSGRDIRRELISRGSLRNRFAIYKREVFDAVGNFNETLKYGIDLEMSIRIFDRYDMVLVPEILYFIKDFKPHNSDILHHSFQYSVPARSAERSRECSSSSESLKGFRESSGFNNRIPFIALRSELLSWYQRFLICCRVSKRNKIEFMKKNKYSVNRLTLLGLSYVLKLPELKDSIEKIFGLPRSIRQSIRTKTQTIAIPYLYNLAATHFSWWPLGLFKSKRISRSLKDVKIAYYTWNFPSLSQTFIQREVTALRESGVSLIIIADTYKNPEILDEKAKLLINSTSYLLPMDKKLLAKYNRAFRRKNPLRYINLFIFVLTHTYGHFKSFKSDIIVFTKAVYLAGFLRDKNITHLHSAWADISAFIVLVASKLLGVTYSLQGRAHEIHRKTFLYCLPEKFNNAKFVVTNTHYNVNHLKSFLASQKQIRLHQIYNGIDLDRFKPTARTQNGRKMFRLLTVARLIEQKGLVYLLKACKILLKRGYHIECKIIGAPEVPLYLNYHLELRKLHHQLGLFDHVNFVGGLPFQQVLDYYQKTDLFVLPCVVAEDGSRDIIPNSLIEAMAMKLPVVSTTVAGIPEIVEDGVSGILVTPNDEHALTEAIIELINDPQLRIKLGKNARKRVEERFDIQKNIVRYIALFREADHLATKHNS